MNFSLIPRRLPFYLIIDCSSSMNGDAIESVDQGFKNLISKLANDPHTSDTVWLSIIVFNSIPIQLVPLSPLHDFFKSLPLPIGGSSNLGAALKLLKKCVNNEVRKQTLEQKGDWKPLVFLMTDGEPTDLWEDFAEALGQEMNIVACGVGSHVEIANLKKITEHVVLLKDMTHETFNQFIEFIGSTLTTASQRSEGRSDKLVIEEKYDKIILT